MIELKTRGARETQKIARMLAETIAATSPRRAVVIALQGELGAGKTTFAQGFARALGVTERVQSPTFVLMKIYDVPFKLQAPSSKFKHLIHIDCYRLASPQDILHLGFREMLKDKDAIILIEWPERIRRIIPPDAVWLRFTHGAKAHQRIIAISEH